MPFLIIFAALFTAVLTVALVRAIRFAPTKTERAPVDKLDIDSVRAAEELSALISCRTVSSREEGGEDAREFARFPKLLAETFRLFHKTCEASVIGERALLYRWRGESAASPVVLMAHYDVVYADESQWSVPPFSGAVKDGFLWGRGALDTKLTVSTMLHAAEMLMRDGFVPSHDVYFAFGGDEEINGRGAPDIVAHFESLGIYPSLVLDEGGAVVKGVFPGVTSSAALIGIAEKGMVNLSYTVNGAGGHASAPKGDTPAVKLARAAIRTVSRPFSFRITEPARVMLDTLARHSTFGYRFVFANLWLFSPVLRLIARGGGELGAIFRTTVAFTELHGAEGANVIPTTASLVSNQRILHGDTPESVREHIERAVGDKSVQVRIINAIPPSHLSRTDVAEYSLVASTVNEVWQSAIVSPYLMIACSDARHWGRLCDRVYRFSPLEFVADERATIHGNDERVALSSVEKAVEFFYRLIRKI